MGACAVGAYAVGACVVGARVVGACAVGACAVGVRMWWARVDAWQESNKVYRYYHGYFYSILTIYLMFDRIYGVNNSLNSINLLIHAGNLKKIYGM